MGYPDHHDEETGQDFWPPESFRVIDASAAVTWFAIGDRAAHDGYIVRETGPAWPVPGGWTYQDVTGAHGQVLYEGPDEAEPRRVLNKFLECDAPSTGAYCYNHNPGGGR